MMKKMKILAWTVLLVLLMFPTPRAGADPLSLEQLQGKMQEIYDNTADMKAHFIQEVTIKAMKRTDREEGTVYFKNPRRMLWSYERPKAKKLVISAKKSWLYLPEDRIAYVQNADSLLKSKLMMRFFSGIGRFKEDFQVAFCRPEGTDREGNYCLILVPKDTGIGVGNLFLTVDKDSYQISRCRFSDTYGNLTQIQFSQIKINSGLSEQLFSFKPPPGTDIVNVP
jgi:outer membrane lipoprotein carrier protein